MEAKALSGYTVADIEAMDESERAELIDGQIYYMAPPVTVHQLIISDLVHSIRTGLEESGKDCKVIPAPFGVYLSDDDRNLVEPDISVICDKDKLDEKGCHGAPDWIIEIASPLSIRMDYSIKLFKYRTAGVREYWVVDPSARAVEVRDFENDDYARYSFDEKVVCAHMPELTVELSEY